MSLLVSSRLDTNPNGKIADAMSDDSHETVAHISPQRNSSTSQPPHKGLSPTAQSPSPLNEKNLRQLSSTDSPNTLHPSNAQDDQSVVSFDMTQDDPYRVIDNNNDANLRPVLQPRQTDGPIADPNSPLSYNFYPTPLDLSSNPQGNSNNDESNSGLFSSSLRFLNLSQ